MKTIPSELPSSPEFSTPGHAHVTGDTPEAVTDAPIASTTGGDLNADPRSAQGVSGSGTLPDQGANLADGPILQSCDKDKQKARKLRVCLPDPVFKRYRALTPSERRKAIAAKLGSDDVDPRKLIAAAGEVNRLGLLLNQYLRLAHMGRVPDELVECVQDVVKTIKDLKP